MKLIIATAELKKMIGKIANIVAIKPNMPILANVLLEAYNDELILTATDLSVGLRCYTEAKISSEGFTTLPAKTLANLVRELTTPTVQIECNKNNITTIISGSSKFKINGMGKDEFPEFPDYKNSSAITISQALLKDLLYRVTFCISKEDSRYVLTGSCLQIQNSTLTFLGTDGKRLARSFASVEIDSELDSKVVIPFKATEEIMKGLQDDGQVNLYILDDKIGVEANDSVLIAKLLSGEYPDLTKIIPEKTEATFNLHREELSSLLRQISLFRSENNHSVRFSFENGELTLSSNTSEIGEGTVSMPVNYFGSKVEIAFNPTYFLDILKHCKNETVCMGIVDSYNPGVIVDQEELNSPLAHSPMFIIMPMRLSED